MEWDSNDIPLIHDCSRPNLTSLTPMQTANTVPTKRWTRSQKYKTRSLYRENWSEITYCYIPLHPSNYKATGLKWKFNSTYSFTYLYDTKLPFGAKQSPEIFHLLTQSIMWMMSWRGFLNCRLFRSLIILNISESEHECWIALWELITLLERLGLTVNWNKVVYPCQPLTYPGIEIDSKRRHFRLPSHKLREICTLISQTLPKSKFTKWE